MRGLAPFVCLGLCAIALADEPVVETTFSEVAQRLAAPKVLRGEFEQTRSLQQISRPLESSGHFILSDHGLYWRQEKPIELVMIADEQRLLQQVGDGSLRSVDVADNPALLGFSRSFLSIFEGSEDALRENFEIEFAPGSDGAWIIGLAPVSYPMRDAIEKITVAGREHIEELSVLSRTSERTIIRFTGLQTQPDQLTEHEVELYAR